MLANMTSGYPDYVQNADFLRDSLENPFRAWTPKEQIEIGLSTPRVFAPGTNWDYSHTNYVILGLALEAATGEPLADLLRRYILDPLNLTGTASEQTAWMPEPVLHAYSSERREYLGIPAGTRFYEESTFWDHRGRWRAPCSTPHRRHATHCRDRAGDLPEASYRSWSTATCSASARRWMAARTAARSANRFTVSGSDVSGWLLQNPPHGYAGTTAYHPDGNIAIGVATTFAEDAFDEQGAYDNASTTIAARIGNMLMPDDPLPGV